MVNIFGGRLFETKDLATLWIDPRHHMLNRSILPRGIHRLKHEQQRITVIGLEKFLCSRQVFKVLHQNFLRPFFHGLLAKLF